MTRVARLLFCLLLAAYAQGWEVQHDTGSEILNHTGMMGVIKLEDGTRIQVQEFKGASKLSVLKHLWETAEVVVECAGHKDFTVFTGPSMEAVRAAYAAKQSAWCGFDRALGRTAACHASISPFGTTAVAVVKPKGWFGDGGAEAAPCTLRREATFSIYRFLASLLGSYLFWNAPTLASNTAFRLTGGTLGFMALSSAVLLFILYRQVPRKRTLAAGAALFGSTFLGALRYMFGTWFPSWSQLLRSPVFLGYFALSGLSGLALTYWYNNPENHKVNTMLNVALHLVGLGLSAAGPSLPEASAAWVASLLGARLVSLLTRHRSVSGLFDQAKRAAQQMAAVGEEELEGLAATKPVKGAQLAVARAGKQLAQQQRKLWPFGNRGGGGASATAGVNNGGAEAAGRGKAGGDGEFAAGAAAAPAPGSGRYTPVLVTARGGPAGDLVAAVEGSGGTPVVGTPHAVAEAEISPLVQRGLVLNEETGHLIHIGKATYNRLVASGYSVDRSKGVITPPPASPTSPIGSPRGSGRGGTRRRRV